MTPPGWNGWLHHTVDTAPSEEDYKPHPWEQPHIGNPTGTPGAILPKGSAPIRGPTASAPAAITRPGARDRKAWPSWTGEAAA